MKLTGIKKWAAALALVTFILAFYGCQKPEAPDFKSIDNIDISLNGFASADLKCDARFYNPNDNTITLKNVNLDIDVDGKFLTNINREYDLKLEPNADFSIPVKANIPFKNVDLKDVMAIMKNTVGEKAFRFRGNIRVKMYGLNFNIPIDHLENIDIR